MPLLPGVGDKFSGCEILARCGDGAFGITFLARNPLGQKVIIKIVSSPNSCERELTGLRNYMRVAGKHPNLLQIYHIGEFEEGFYYTMEAADNFNNSGDYYPATLGNCFRKKRIFSPEESLDIIRKLTDALQVMHTADLIHRDIKPDNIIFVNGQPKLSDPGLVITVGENASFAGTLGFIPPEMVDGESVPDQSADIYALGKVFYCMVTNYHPKQYPALPVDMRLEVCRQLYPVLNRLCNRNPQKRYRTAGELLENLPRQLRAPNCWEKLREDFRNWKQLNYKRYIFCKRLAAAVLLTVLLLLAGTGLLLRYMSQRQKAVENRIEAFHAINQDRHELLLLQMQTFMPEKVAEYQALQQKIADAQKRADWNNADIYLHQLREFMQSTARAAIPALPTSGDTKLRTAAIGRMYGFLASPLAEYLPEKEREALREKIRRQKQIIYKNQVGMMRCGEDLDNFQDYYLPMKFVPPGVVKMDHTGKTERIDYHYWIGIKEVENNHYSNFMKVSPQQNHTPGFPVTRAAWNDILFYSYKLTEFWQDMGKLPPGYIIRPPTEVEWEYAAKNAWLGKDTLPLEERANIRSNSQKQPWPAGRKAPGKLGLLDMYGNVAEIVQPAAPTAMQQAVIVRGGSFMTSVKKFRHRLEYLKYQNIPYDIGFRLAVAPGDMSYFDKEFFLGGAVQTRSRGKIYELIGANVGVFNWHSADALSKLLGGTLAEIEDQDQFNELKKSIPLLGAWETALGATRDKDGKWRWQNSRRLVSFGQWQNSPEDKTGKHLSLNKKKWKAARKYTIPIFLCQWDQEQYRNLARRTARLPRLPMELHRFTYKNRRYILLQKKLHWLTAKRVCELLGGRLAVLSDKSVAAHVRRELAKFRQHRIWLGGYAKREKFYYLDNSEIKPVPMEDATVYIPSRNLNYIMLHKDALYSGQSACCFLLELDMQNAVK
ncbi:MAG: SUMF1/EgtB/PvdO family nonheme iron enzyme [Lentisphaeria bacterium]|nr:SUMF1/EgtB/PvdO family nonheme iron enzyme [Lentisphaeria bacterium]